MLNIQIKNYYGVVENGILTILTIEHNKLYYEGTYWYSDTIKLMTIEKDLEDIIGNIDDDINYDTYIKNLSEQATPIDQLINILPKLEIDE